MKKIMLTVSAILLLLLLQSCKDVPTGPTAVIPSCAWNKTENVVFYNLQLKYPDGLSNSHIFQLPFDKIDRSFIDVIVRNSELGTRGNKANILTNVKSDGTKCIGEKTSTYDISNYVNGGLGGNTIKTPFPSNAAFIGEITVTLKSNVYSNTSGSGGGVYYHILWEQTGNNPNGGMAGTMNGKKITYYSISGKDYIVPEEDNNFYYSDGELIFL